jgi:PIN domain nuclease of toxin-antitoxin system
VDAKAAIADLDNDAYLSTASPWKVAIKINIGKRRLPAPLGEIVTEQVQENAFDIPRPEILQDKTYVDLPRHHRDPLDHMIIA